MLSDHESFDQNSLTSILKEKDKTCMVSIINTIIFKVSEKYESDNSRGEKTLNIMLLETRFILSDKPISSLLICSKFIFL